MAQRPVPRQNSIRTENGAILIGDSVKTLKSTQNCFRECADPLGVVTRACARMVSMYKDERKSEL
jgi:hypothetical protein